HNKKHDDPSSGGDMRRSPVLHGMRELGLPHPICPQQSHRHRNEIVLNSLNLIAQSDVTR
ncbi:hypothetical protein ACQP3J_31740, partial [Escherichia coli]